MIGKILAHLLGNPREDSEAAGETNEELQEFEEEEWVIVNIQGPESGTMSAADVDPLENLLIEHPSMSVYQRGCRSGGAEEELALDEDEEETSRPVAVRHISWHLAAWGNPLPCNLQLLAVQRPWSQAERKKMSRSALHRQNTAKMQFSPKDRRYGHLRCPSPRLYNY